MGADGADGASDGRERVRSVRQFLRDGENPHLERIFSFGANPTQPSSIQTTVGTSPLRPGSSHSPTKQTVIVSLIPFLDYIVLVRLQSVKLVHPRH